MNSHPASARRRTRALLASLAVVTLLGGTVACSSGSDSTSADTSASAPKSGSKSKADSATEIPDGFPDDVPLPEFEKIQVIKRGTETMPGAWVVLVTIDPTLEERGEDLMAAYSKQLEGAGFEVEEDDDGTAEAENDTWSVGYHSSMDGTLTISTIEQ